MEQLGGKRGSSNIDIWKLKLDGTGKDFVRLTHFNDYRGRQSVESRGFDGWPIHGLSDREDHAIRPA